MDADLPSPTLYDLATLQLWVIGEALRLPPPTVASIERTVLDIGSRCGNRPLSWPPRWSGLSDDASPVEWSVAFRRGGPDLRLLVEAQADPADPAAYWDAGTALTQWLAEHLGADASVVEPVLDLFTPTDPTALFATYHGIEWRHDGTVRTKLYLNPAAAGRPPGEVVKQALTGLGLASGWASAPPEVLALAPVLLCVDLVPAELARVKVYLRSGDPAVLRAAVAWAGDDPDDVDALLAALCTRGKLARPAFVVLHLAPSSVRPVRAVVDVPVSANCGNDAEAITRITALLDSHHLDRAAYQRVATGLAHAGPTGDVPPEHGYGLHNYVSFQREGDGSPRVTSYFGLRGYALAHGWCAVDPAITWPSPIVAPSGVSGVSGPVGLLDADAHLMPPADTWEELYGPVGVELRARLAGAASLATFYGTEEGDVADPAAVWQVKGSGAPGSTTAAGRVAALHALGVARQLVFPDPLGWLALLAPGAEAREGRARYNEWIGRFTADTGGSAVGVAVVNPDNLDGLLREVDHALASGAGAVVLPHASPPGGLDPGSAELDPLWARFVAAGVPVLLHLGGESGFLHGARWGRVPGVTVGIDDFGGAGEPMDARSYTVVAHAAELYLASLVLGGALARHPGLRIGVIELGCAWVGPLLERLDAAASMFADRVDGVISEAPSVSLRRQVRVTPSRWEPLGQLFGRYPALTEMACFSTDFPHREGGTDPVGQFRDLLRGAPPDVVERFFHGNAASLFPATITPPGASPA